jgi:hypothetical protein
MPDYIQRLRCRLAELGCPSARLNRMVREVADHRDDLVEAARAEKIATSEAEACADAKLGDPIVLAGDLMRTFRRSNWWGRNYLFTFGFLPILAFPLLWALFLAAGLSLIYVLCFGWNQEKLDALPANSVGWHYLSLITYGADYLAIGLVALVICWQARRSGVRLVWMFIACLVCSFYAMFSFTYVEYHRYTIGYTWPPHWDRGLIPVFVATAFYLRHRWTIHFHRWRSAI